ncbi:dTDP-4-amino-4,6-dideoxyglucose formyltransferase [Patescibacteria group bacterium]|nr:dTDP-4-amino-4,6-dideoxyglucose formyltransferase [Patescibacteria group bacterium]
MNPYQKNILVISDNPSLLRFFQNECSAQHINDIATIKYCYSSNNKMPSELITLGATPINLKNENIINLKSSYHLIFSIHCKQIFPSDLVSSVSCINVHPGFNPYNRGWYPQVFSIINKKPIGATIHIMDEMIDHGAIIDQIQGEIYSNDTSKDVYERVIELEKVLIKNNLMKIILGDFSAIEPLTEGNYNSIEDFKTICHLNLDDTASLRDHIDLLRALSHSPFKNAFFIDEQGKKVFVRLTLEKE